uniref:Uncharacterized protein n=1 Tax=Tetradesmus obliquus TaxID=3088 RepID=A0A383VT52_TETOB|eukprot:jgi/Sobl393_1/5156/SZX67989.1
MMSFSRSHCAKAPRNYGCSKGAYTSRPRFKEDTIKSRIISAAQALLTPSGPTHCPVAPDFSVSPRTLERFIVTVLLTALGCYSLQEYLEAAGHIDNEHHWPQVEAPSDEECEAAGWPFTTTTTTTPPALQAESTSALQEESTTTTLQAEATPALLPATTADSLPATADSSIAAEAAAGLAAITTTTLQAESTPALLPATAADGPPVARDSSIAIEAAAGLIAALTSTTTTTSSSSASTTTILMPAIDSFPFFTASHTCTAADSKPMAMHTPAAVAAATPTFFVYVEADSSSDCAPVAPVCCSTLHQQQQPEQADAAGAEGHTCHSLAPAAAAGKAKHQLLQLQQPPAGCGTAAELAGAADNLQQQNALHVHCLPAAAKTAAAAVVVRGGGSRCSSTASSWLRRVSCKLFSCAAGSSLSRVDWM